MKFKFLTVTALAIGLATVNLAPAMAATFSGMIIVTRGADRAIASAVLETNNRDGAGKAVSYKIAMDENGRAIAEQYENRDIKIDGALNGSEIKADTWESVADGAAKSSSPSQPATEPDTGDDPQPGDSSGSDDSGDKPTDDNGDADKPVNDNGDKPTDDSGDSDKPVDDNADKPADDNADSSSDSNSSEEPPADDSSAD